MMNRYFRSVGTLTASLVLAGTVACNNDTLAAVNANPNSPEDAPAGAVFTNAAQTAVGRWLGAGYDLRATEFIAQHLAEVQYPDEDRYARLRAGDTQGYFAGAGGAYATSLEDFRQVIKKGVATNSSAIYAPASIMQQWEFGYLTDSWGPVPYSTALAGDSTAGGSAVLLPSYDKQKDIYTGILSALGKAANDLKTPGLQSLGAADVIYGGDPAKWQKFANSLHARQALHLSNVDPAKAAAELAAALNGPGGVFTSNSDNAVLRWPGDGIFDNPWASNFKTRDDHRMSKTLVDSMVAQNDPRLPIYAQPTVDWQNGKAGAAKYAGQPNGLSQAVAGSYFTSTSRPGAIFYPGATAYGTFGGNGAKQPSYLMTYSEVLFIQAEAAQRGWAGLTPAQAAGFYNAAIQASMEQWGVTDAAAIAAYLAQPGVVYNPATGLAQIAQQKWESLFTNGGQAWFEYRRTCTPPLAAGPAAIFTTVPRRFEFPTLENSVNGANVTAALADLSPATDAMTSRMYIDPKTTCGP